MELHAYPLSRKSIKRCKLLLEKLIVEVEPADRWLEVKMKRPIVQLEDSAVFGGLKEPIMDP